MVSDKGPLLEPALLGVSPDSARPARCGPPHREVGGLYRAVSCEQVSEDKGYGPFEADLGIGHRGRIALRHSKKRTNIPKSWSVIVAGSSV